MTMPLVPPYSSTTTAMGICDFCMSRSTSSRLCVSGTKRSSRLTRLERGKLRVLRIEEEVLRVEVAGDLVDALLLREDHARVLVRAELLGRLLAGRAHWEHEHVDARHHRMARGAVREARDALEEIRAALAAGAARGARRENADELVLREGAFAGGVRAHAHAAQNELRRALEDPEQRLEGDVDELEEARGAERHGLGALDRDELRDELAEEHVTERQDRERDDDHDVVEDVAGLVPGDEVRDGDRPASRRRARQSSRARGSRA